MKSVKLFLTALAVLTGTSVLAQSNLKEVVAPGNKVFVQIVNDADHPLPEDEMADLTRVSAEAGEWACVESAEEADFILRVEAKKKMVFNSPRTWLTPSVVDKEGNVLWQGDTYKADATLTNGFRATNACIRKMLEKGFQKNLFVKAER